jgi:hypothetical protein
MATSSTTIETSIEHPAKTYRRWTAFAIAATLVVGGAVATAVVIADGDDPAPAHAPAQAQAPANDPLITRFGEPQSGSSATDAEPQPLLKLSGPR